MVVMELWPACGTLRPVAKASLKYIGGWFGLAAWLAGCVFINRCCWTSAGAAGTGTGAGAGATDAGTIAGGGGAGPGATCTGGTAGGGASYGAVGAGATKYGHRGTTGSHQDMDRVGEEAKERGEKLLVFPEGTRNSAGDLNMLPFKKVG